MPARIPADVDRLFAESLSSGGLDGALAMYEDDACFMTADGTVARGREKIRIALADLLRLNPTLVCHEIDVVQHGDLAALRASWTFTGTNAEGKQFESYGRSIEILRRQSDGTWRFTIDLPSGAT